MIRIVNNDLSNMYFVTSANWEFCCESTSFIDAASLGLKSMFEKLGKNVNLSPAIIVINMSAYSVNFSDTHSKVFSTSEILSNLGMHDLAKKIKSILPE